MTTGLSFLAPSLHPNTLVDITVAPSSDPGPSSRQPIVKSLPIKYGEHAAVGNVKRIVESPAGEIVVADDLYQISHLRLGAEADQGGPPNPPEVIQQYRVAPRKGDVFTGLVSVQAGTISSLTSGRLTLHPSSSSSTTTPPTRLVPSPLLCLSSSPASATKLALAGKEVDVSLWDIERTFTSADAEPSKPPGAIKRKKDALEPGEIWRAKNVPNNSLSLRPPVHHLCLSHLPTDANGLVSGTKGGTVRRFDTRQRKPVGDWKIAREGGVGCIVAADHGHEVYFADRSSFCGALDLRTGKLLYAYSALNATPHHLLALSPDAATGNVGLASIASDATLRLHSTLPVADTDTDEGQRKRNAGGLGMGKPGIVGMVGGVGVGQAVYMGRREMPAVAADGDETATKGGKDGEGEEEEDDDEEGDEEVWEGMNAVADASGSDDSDEDEEEDDEPPKRKGAAAKKRRV